MQRPTLGRVAEMSDDQARWAALETALASHQVRERIQSALAAQRAWVRRIGGKAPFVGTVDERRFILRTSSRTKEFAIEGAMEPNGDGTRVIISVAALRRRPFLQALAVAFVIAGGLTSAWVEVQTDPDWPETAITATTLSLGLVFSWASTIAVTLDEASRITARLSQLIDAASSASRQDEERA